MTRLSAPIEPYDQGMLDVGDGNLVSWETCGNPDGKPAVVVHGGPGSGSPVGLRRSFNPQHYRVVLFDQRGCGRSTPHASDPATDMDANTTHHLIADMDRLREHLGIDRWLLFGGSWGCTLSLAYAQRFPHRVSEMVLVSITTSTRAEIDWLYRGARSFFPEAWERFRDAVLTTDRDSDIVTILGAYRDRMGHPDPHVREHAAAAWCDWEDTVLSLEPSPKKNPFGSRPTAGKHALVRTCAHYGSNAAWLEEGELLRNAGLLADVPSVLIHGRHDLGCPVATAWELARVWPSARLTVVEDSGHTGSAAMGQRLDAALDAFATR